MLKSTSCPFCTKIAELKNEKVIINFGDEPIDVNSYFYKCNNCKEEFTTTDLCESTLKQIK